MADKFEGKKDAAARAAKPEPRTTIDQTIDQLIKESGVFTHTANKARKLASTQSKTEEEMLAAGRKAVVDQIFSIIDNKEDGHPAQQAARAAFAEASAAGKTGYDQQAAAAIAGLKVLREVAAAAALTAKAAPKTSPVVKAAPKTEPAVKTASTTASPSSDKNAKTTKRSFFNRFAGYVFGYDPPVVTSQGMSKSRSEYDASSDALRKEGTSPKPAPKTATAPKPAPKTAAHSSSDASSDKGAKTTKRSFLNRFVGYLLGTDPPVVTSQGMSKSRSEYDASSDALRNEGTSPKTATAPKPAPKTATAPKPAAHLQAKSAAQSVAVQPGKNERAFLQTGRKVIERELIKQIAAKPTASVSSPAATTRENVDLNNAWDAYDKAQQPASNSVTHEKNENDKDNEDTVNPTHRVDK